MKIEITFEESITYWIKTLETKGAFSSTDLLIFLYKLKKDKAYEGSKVTNLRSNTKLSTLFNRSLSFLEEKNFIKLTNYDYCILRNRKYSDLELICAIYPYGYISFLTAMNFYNLIHCDSKNIDFVIPTRQQWKEYEKSQIDSIISEDKEVDLKNFYHSYPSKNTKFNRKKVNIYTSKHLHKFNIASSNIRVIDIGCLFLEMLHSPEKCGGFNEVIEIFDKHATLYLTEIIEAANSYGTNLDKSKLGYIFEERLGVSHTEIQNWKTHCVARGGSRKMLSSEPYSDIYSESWCISLNHSIFSINNSHLIPA